MNGRVGPLVAAGKTGDLKEAILKHLQAITIALLPSAALAQQFTPEQLIEVMTKSPENRDVRVHDSQTGHFGGIPTRSNLPASSNMRVGGKGQYLGLRKDN